MTFSLTTLLMVGSLAADTLSNLRETNRAAHDPSQAGALFSVEAQIITICRADGCRILNAEDSSDNGLLWNLTDTACRSGDRIRASGHIDPQPDGHRTVCVTNLVVLGHAPFPAAVACEGSQIVSGEMRGRSVCLRGVVMKVMREDLYPEWNWILLRTRSGTICVSASEYEYPITMLRPLVDAEVTLIGRAMTSSGKIRILVADDHAIVRLGLVALLRKEKDMTVVGEAEDGIEAVREAERLKPDVILLDLMMPKMDGADATAAIHAKVPATRILILTTYGTSEAIGRSLRSGASGAVQKNLATAELLAAIRDVAAGKTVLSADIRDTLASDDPIPDLTERQMEILQSVTRGLTNNEIARQYGITYDGVKAHLKAIFGKLGVSGRSEAIAIALRKHLLKI